MSIRSIGNSRYDIDQNIAPMPRQLWRLIGLPQAEAELPNLLIISGGTWRQKAVRYGYCYTMCRLHIFKSLYLQDYYPTLAMAGRKD
jgi:hypothetical protein